MMDIIRCNAAREASEQGMHVIAFTGKDGGQLATCCDVEICAPQSQFSDRVQEIHTKVVRMLVQIIIYS